MMEEDSATSKASGPNAMNEAPHGFTNAIVDVFLKSNLSLILILLAIILGLTAP